jgi:hypothetical protein
MAARYRIVDYSEIAASPGHRLDAGYYLGEEPPVTIRITSLQRRQRYEIAGEGWQASEGWQWTALDSRWRTNHDGEGLWRWALGENEYEWRQVRGTGQFSIRAGSQSPVNVRARIARRFDWSYFLEGIAS